MLKNLNLNIIKILQLGSIGLGFLLALLSYSLLSKEQKNLKPRSNIIYAIYMFMFFSLLLCIIGIVSQLFINDTKTQHEKGILSEKVFYSYFKDIKKTNSNTITSYIANGGLFKYIHTSRIGHYVYRIKAEIQEEGIDKEAVGYIHRNYLVVSYPTGIGLFEKDNRDYVGYWIGETFMLDRRFAFCPWVLTPDEKQINNIEEAKSYWSIFEKPCIIFDDVNMLLDEIKKNNRF